MWHIGPVCTLMAYKQVCVVDRLPCQVELLVGISFKPHQATYINPRSQEMVTEAGQLP